MSESSDASPFSARGRRPHLADSVRRYASSSSRRPETSEAPERVAKSSSPGPRVRVVQPKSLDTCGPCKSGRLELPEDFALNLAQEVKKQVMDMADLMINPLGAGPFQLAKALEDKRSKQLEDLDRVDRLWEFRLCVEMLRDCLDTFSTHGERDSLSTADETLLTAEDLLRRITELAVMHNNSDEALLDLISHASPSGTFAAEQESKLLMQVLQSPDFREKGGLTASLLSSRLMISGLLESVLGELTCWRSHPSEADLQAWKRWDRTYELCARRVAAVQQSQHVPAGGTGGPVLGDLWRQRPFQGTCDAEEVVECVACRPACTPLCGYGRA